MAIHTHAPRFLSARSILSSPFEIIIPPEQIIIKKPAFNKPAWSVTATKGIFFQKLTLAGL